MPSSLREPTVTYYILTSLGRIIEREFGRDSFPFLRNLIKEVASHDATRTEKPLYSGACVNLYVKLKQMTERAEWSPLSGRRIDLASQFVFNNDGPQDRLRVQQRPTTQMSRGSFMMQSPPKVRSKSSLG